MNLKKKFLLVAVLIVAAAVMLAVFMEYYGDWLWFENLGFGQVFTTILWAKFLAFAVFFCIFGIFAGANIIIARRWGRATRTPRPATPEVPHSVLDIIFHEAYSSYVWALIVLSFSVLLGYSASKSWMTFLQFLHRTPFGVSDPIYHRDLGFYLFTLPLYYFFQGWYLSTIFLVAIGVGLSYYLDQAIGARENRLYIYPRAKSHLGVLGGLFLLGIAWTYWIKLYGLMYSRSGVAYGASYSDVYARIPAYWILMILTVALAVFLFLMPVVNRWRWVLPGTRRVCSESFVRFVAGQGLTEKELVTLFNDAGLSSVNVQRVPDQPFVVGIGNR